MNFEMALRWEERKGFSYTFASPVGKQRRPISPVCGDSEVPARHLLVLESGEWRGDGGDRLRSSVGCPGAVTDCWTGTGGTGTNPCQPGWDRSGGGGGEQACFLHRKQNWLGLKDNFSAEGETQSCPSA